MKVITAIGKDFDMLCSDMAKQIVTDNYRPDIIIGVLTGGGIIGRMFKKYYHEFCPHNKFLYTEIKVQRVSTKAKEKSGVRKFLTKLPMWMLNYLRIWEVEFFEWKMKFVYPKREGDIVVSNDVNDVLREGKKNILLIDDCIDTGRTLRIIKDYLERKYPYNQIKVAVATVAHRHPIINADYKLYNRVLIRFPWANDVKKKD